MTALSLHEFANLAVIVAGLTNPGIGRSLEGNNKTVNRDKYWPLHGPSKINSRKKDLCN